MPGHLRHRHSPRQAEYLGVDIEVPLRPAAATVNLEQLAPADQPAIVTGLKASRLGLAPAPGLVPILLDLDQLREPKISLEHCWTVQGLGKQREGMAEGSQEVSISKVSYRPAGV
jgi:hypothetical protein